MPTSNLLTVKILKGRKFPPGTESVRISGNFARDIQSTEFSQASKEGYEWNSALEWKIENEKLRKVTARGLGTCKLVAEGPSDEKLGWVVLDLRSAKLNATRGDYDGQWLPLRGPQLHPLHLPPELFVFYIFQDEHQVLLPNRSPTPKSQHQKSVVWKIPESSTNPLTNAMTNACTSKDNGSDPIPGLSVDTGVDHGYMRKEEINSNLVGELNGREGGNMQRRIEQEQERHGVQLENENETENQIQNQIRDQIRDQILDQDHNRNQILDQNRDQNQIPDQDQRNVGISNVSRNIWNSTMEASIPHEGPKRQFRMTVDLRTFRGGAHLPYNLASVFIQAALPRELCRLISNSPHNGDNLHGTFPIRTNPPVDCARGSEVCLSGGIASIDFCAGIVTLATVLAKEPRIIVDVWHKERHKLDTLLGVASVPLSPLLGETFVDRLAPVYAMLVPTKENEPSLERQVEVGAVRVILSIEDLGPARSDLDPKYPKYPQECISNLDRIDPATSGPVSCREVTELGNSTHGNVVRSVAESIDEGNVASARSDHDQQNQITGRQASVMQTTENNSHDARNAPDRVTGYDRISDDDFGDDFEKPSTSRPTPAPYQRRPPKNTPSNQPQSQQNERHLINEAQTTEPRRQISDTSPEFAAAWEIELWKQSESSKFIAEMRDLESERMAVLENEWRRHEKMREEEVAAMRGEYSALEIRLKSALDKVEEREKKLVAAEDGLARRRKEAEKERVARLTEAESAVRRLQVECEHQLSIERDRNSELIKKCESLEERLTASDMRANAIERNFAEYRDVQKNSPEMQLKNEIFSLTEKLSKSESIAEKLRKAKNSYKTQVIKLAQEMGQAYRNSENQFLNNALPLPFRPLNQVDWISKDNAKKMAKKTKVQMEELSVLKEQLNTLKNASMKSPSPSTSPQKAPLKNPTAQINPEAAQQPQGSCKEAATLSSGILNGGSCKEAAVFKGGILNGENSDVGSCKEAARTPQNEELVRLLKERTDLLATGVYSGMDDVIVELDRKIADMSHEID